MTSHGWALIPRNLIDLNTALDTLNGTDSALVQTLELRFFLGCTIQETAEIMGLSEATVKRNIKFAKTWLYRRIAPSPNPLSSRV